MQFEIKDKLAKEVASAIPDDTSIMMGIDTTVTRIAYHLKSKTRVVTNDFQVMRFLEATPDVEVYIAGGVFIRLCCSLLWVTTNKFHNQAITISCCSLER